MPRNISPNWAPSTRSIRRKIFRSKSSRFSIPTRQSLWNCRMTKNLRLFHNDFTAMEKYYNDTIGLSAADESERQKLQSDLFEMNQSELDGYLARIQAMIAVLKQTPVPSELVGIHKLKIAQLTAGIRMIDLVKVSYRPDEENKQFWSDFFAQIVASQEASQLELLAWGELGMRLRDEGGLPA